MSSTLASGLGEISATTIAFSRILSNRNSQFDGPVTREYIPESMARYIFRIRANDEDLSSTQVLRSVPKASRETAHFLSQGLQYNLNNPS